MDEFEGTADEATADSASQEFWDDDGDDTIAAIRMSQLWDCQLSEFLDCLYMKALAFLYVVGKSVIFFTSEKILLWFFSSFISPNGKVAGYFNIATVEVEWKFF